MKVSSESLVRACGSRVTILLEVAIMTSSPISRTSYETVSLGSIEESTESSFGTQYFLVPWKPKRVV
jgi:hypothetical protein